MTVIDRIKADYDSLNLSFRNIKHIDIDAQDIHTLHYIMVKQEGLRPRIINPKPAEHEMSADFDLEAHLRQELDSICLADQS